MKILGIDTSGRTGTIGITAGESLVGEYTLNIEMMHAERLLPMVGFLLENTGMSPQDLDGIGVGTGPGYFTALRIGVASAKTMAQALAVPVVGIPSLDLLALQSSSPSDCLLAPVVDAGRGELYTAVYRGSVGGEMPERKSEYHLLAPHRLGPVVRAKAEGRGQQVILAGSGTPNHEKELRSSIEDQDLRPVFLPPAVFGIRGPVVALLAARRWKHYDKQALFQLSPLYIRRSDAELSRDKKQEAE